MERRAFLRRFGGPASLGGVSTLAGCSTLGFLGSDEPFTVSVEYDGSWSGSVGSEDGQRSVEGTGPARFEVDGDVVSAVAQKRSPGSGQLTVRIAVGDDVVKRQSTTARFGTVSVSHRRGEEDDVDGETIRPRTETADPEREREQDRAALAALEVERVGTYASGSEGYVFVTVEVRNPTSDGIGAGVVAELNLDGRDYTYRRERFLPIESGTSETQSIGFPEIVEDGPDIGSVADFSPQGSENAVRCEQVAETGYECETPDYTAHVTFVPEYEVRGE